ncbi:hypothetical protein [Mesorhizobium sp. WSM3626]|uniref:hypothetical protein n=1 Tax=Mesorhizobium sp. WSM3626 TaxID=1040987 RepID=UPI0004AF08DC|nr:hypothetical protein [Mesorhizobium sp. WSM3626]
MKPAIQPRTLVAPDAGKTCLHWTGRKTLTSGEGIGFDGRGLRWRRVINPALPVHYGGAAKRRFAPRPAKFSMRPLVIGHSTVSLAAT